MNFVKLVKLVDIKDEGESAEQNQRWLNNLKVSEVEDGWTYTDIVETHLASNMELIETGDIEVFDFMGSAFEDERFYIKDVDVFKHKVTGDYYIIDRPNVWEF